MCEQMGLGRLPLGCVDLGQGVFLFQSYFILCPDFFFIY